MFLLRQNARNVLTWDSFCAIWKSKKEYKYKKIDDPSLYFGTRNYKFPETRDADGNVTWDISEDAWENNIKAQLEGIVAPFAQGPSWLISSLW